jgi:glycerophosphoryl diester phosphodiesterase
MGSKTIWTIAHRGASGHAPENTMAAFGRAVELGARFIETDLQVTRDAQVIALHDFTLDRTTSGKGQAHLSTLEEIRALDAGSWFGDHGSNGFRGERVPTLREILDFAKQNDVILYLEIKSGPAWGVEHAVVAALRDENASGLARYRASPGHHHDDRAFVGASIERSRRAHRARGGAATGGRRRPHHHRGGR